MPGRKPQDGAGGDGPGPAVTSVPGAPARVLTVPNLLTALRLVCLPVFVWLLARPHGQGYLASGFLLGSLGLTDTLDGRIARRFHQESALGRVADPLVDRLLVLCAAIGCAVTGAIPWWLLALVLGREALVLVGAVILAAHGARALDVSRMGKLGALGMMVALPWFLIGHAHFRWHTEFTVGAWVAAAFGLVLAWAAAFGYVPQARRALGRPAPEATEDRAPQPAGP